MWYFSSSKSLQKIEKIQERPLRFLYNEHTSSYDDLLLKSNKCTMLVARQRILCIEIFKTVKQLNPPFMQNIFRLRSSHYSLRNPNSLAHVRPNQTTFGSNSLSCIGPQIWNGLPNEIKSAENLKSFKKTFARYHIADIYQRIIGFSKFNLCFFYKFRNYDGFNFNSELFQFFKKKKESFIFRKRLRVQRLNYNKVAELLSSHSLQREVGHVFLH